MSRVCFSSCSGNPFSCCLAANSSLIFFPARRMRFLPMSQIVQYPAFLASLSLIIIGRFVVLSIIYLSFSISPSLYFSILLSYVSSGSCTMMNLRFPLSFAFKFITACAVVAEPEKKSSIKESFKSNRPNKYCMSSLGLE